MERVHNFSAGPATLPLDVLKKAKGELLNYREKGASIMEMSHRSPEFVQIEKEATERLKSLLGADDDWKVLFLQGGASSQFMMAPHNFLNEGRIADYIDTGTWSAKAIKEAKLFGNVHVPFSSKDHNYNRVPNQNELKLSDSSVYTHITSNNTIFGTQFATEPDVNSPLICDASSDFLSRPINLDKYGLIYAGAQKNLGPAGVTIVMVRESFLKNQRKESIPTILNYKTHAEKIFNTPPVFAIYMVNLVLGWIKEKGGLNHFKSFNSEKASLLYHEIDRDGFYEGTVEKDSRSKMNVTFRIRDQELEATFLSEAEKQGLVALKGHRSVGGIRASIYNACELGSVKALKSFMIDFRNSHG